MSKHEGRHDSPRVNEVKRQADGGAVRLTDGEDDGPGCRRSPRRGESVSLYGALLRLIAGVIAFSSAANAATFLVSKTADTNDGACDADCSLREAVIAANAAAGADTIVLPTGTFLLTIPDTDEDFALDGDLDIRDELALNGLGTATTFVDGDNATRAFHLLTTAPVSIRDLAIRNAVTSGFGAAIHHAGAGAVTLSNLVVTDNAAGGFGGGINNHSSGSISIQSSTISGNSTQGSSLGGGINNNWTGSISIADSEVSNNTAAGWAGGINNNDLGTLTVLNSTVSDNSSQGWGGGINNNYGGPVAITLTTISGNSAENGGGLNNNDARALTLDRSTVAGNSATDTNGIGGGGILNNWRGAVTLTATTVSGNASAGYGGGGSNNNGSGTVTLANSTNFGNLTTGSEGGGGICDNGNAGAVVLDFVTLAGNGATNCGRSLHVNNVRGGAGVFSLRSTIVANPTSGSASEPKARAAVASALPRTANDPGTRGSEWSSVAGPSRTESVAAAALVGGALAPAVAGATRRIRAEEAAVRAVNTLRPDGDRLVLRQPHDRVEFASEGVRFEPRRGPAWSWSLRAVEVGGAALPGVRLAGVGPRADGLTARYERGALVEEYVAHADGIEQRFVLGAPPAATGALVLVGEVASAGSFETLARGWRWRNDRGAVRLGEVFAYDATGAALPATLEVTATGTRIVLDGAALAAARYPVTVDPEIGANDFRISDMGGTGDASYDAYESAVAYNATDNEYLVVWVGDDDVGGLVDNEYEIFGQRLDAATGAEVGGNDFRISDMGGTGDVTYGAVLIAVAYNATENEYLVVWRGEDNVGGLVDGETEVFGQRLDAATGAEVGGNDFRISDMGGTGDANYDIYSVSVAHDAADNEYLVVWMGDDNVGGLVDNEYEIFGQRLDATTGAEVGGNDFRISDMGGTGDASYEAEDAAVAYNSIDNEYLVVWKGDDNAGGLVNDEYEIFGQRLNAATGTALGGNDFRISDMGGTGDTGYRAGEPVAAYNAADNEYVVVWMGDDDVGGLVDGEYEIFGQRLDAATGAEVGDNDFRISEMGGTGNATYDAYNPAVAYNAAHNGFVVVWRGDHDEGGLSDNELEIFGELLGPDGATIGPNNVRLSDMGGTGDNPFGVNSPTVAHGGDPDELLVVWTGDDDVDGLVEAEYEIFGQRLTGDPLLLFLDGFESGGTNAWSATVP